MTARRVAALYDIHGNLPALEAVLAHLDTAGFDVVVVGGDVVVGPFPRQTLEALLALGDRALYVRGNTDRAIVEIDPTDQWYDRNIWVRDQLSKEQLMLISAWPNTVTVEIAGRGPTLFCHGSPRSDLESLTRATPPERLDRALAGVEAPVVVCGHTHMQFDRVVDGFRVVNAGSVGMPYEGRPGAAYWAWLGPDVELTRTPYDIEAAAERIRASGLPAAGEFADEYVLSSYPPDEVVELFERMAAEREAGT